MKDEELSAWLRLCLTPGVGNETARALLTRYGLPEDVFRQSRAELLRTVEPGQAQALSLIPQSLEIQLATTIEWLRPTPSGSAGQAGAAVEHHWRRVVALGDPEYPEDLLQIEDPPLMLYLMGHGRLWRKPPATGAPGGSDPDPRPCLDQSIAIVGSRNPTPQGETNARQFAKALTDAGLTVVSGMALGIDGAAHGGALEADGPRRAGLPTLAVVGTGLDRVYPKQHLALARKICQHGLMISEYPLGTPPQAGNFPRRNRLIAALSRGALVVEAATQSGSLITARFAAEQGKEVFAIPGSIHSPLSHGCHALIRQGAKLVESAQDVLEELQGLPQRRPVAENESSARPSPDADERLLKWLGYDPVGLDALVARSGMSASDWQVRLLDLELAGWVVRLPGGSYQRITRT